MLSPLHFDAQSRQEQHRAAHRRRLADRQQDRLARRLRDFLRQDFEQYVLRASRRERSVPTNFHKLHSGQRESGLSGLRTHVPQCVLHSAGSGVAAVFSGALTPVVLCTVAATTPPAIPPPPSCPTLGSGTLPALAQAAHGMTPNFVNPAAHEGELTIERQIPGRMTVSATYLLTRGLHLPASYDANVARQMARRKPMTSLAERGGRFDAVYGDGAFLLTRLDSGTGIILNQSSVVNSWYNALVLTLRKPMSHGVELLLNYTYSKALDDGQTAGTNGTFFGTDGCVRSLQRPW